MVIIGIDPGSRITGYGIIHCAGNQTTYIASGCLRVSIGHVSTRLQQIFTGLKEIVQQYQPLEAAIEQIFMHQNPRAALKLGQARGVAIVAVELPVAEYSARQVKQSVVGYGAATKEQVQNMVMRLLNIQGDLQADAADALAIALCHAHTRSSLVKIHQSAEMIVKGKQKKQKKASRWRDYQPL
jgi:crossover junction endodeoxyribonuclease RuvC